MMLENSAVQTELQPTETRLKNILTLKLLKFILAATILKYSLQEKKLTTKHSFKWFYITKLKFLLHWPFKRQAK